MSEFTCSLKPEVETDNLLEQKCYLLNEAIQDVVAATTFGMLCNYNTFSDGRPDEFKCEEKKDLPQKDPTTKGYSALPNETKSFGLNARTKANPANSNHRIGAEVCEKVNKVEESGRCAGGFVPASVRLRWLQDGNTHLKSLLADLQSYILSPNLSQSMDEAKKSESTVNGSAKNAFLGCKIDKNDEKINPKEKDKRACLALLRGRVNRNLFVNHCGLNLKPSEFSPCLSTLPTGSYSPKGTNEQSPLLKENSREHAQAKATDLLKPLTDLSSHTEKIRSDIASKVQHYIPQTDRHGESGIFSITIDNEKGRSDKDENKVSPSVSMLQENRNAHEGARRLCSSLQGLDELIQQKLFCTFERIIKADMRTCKENTGESQNAPNVLTELMMANDSAWNKQALLVPSRSALVSLTTLVREIATWPECLLNLIKTSISAPSPAKVCESAREKLKRIAFDVEGLQLEQEKAITDGDMKKSEEIYYRQSSLLNSMEPIFSSLEKILETYKTDGLSKPLEKAALLRSEFVNRQKECLQREEDALYKVQTDQDKLTFERKKLLTIRAEQQKGLANYLEEWDNLYNISVSEQVACLRAMDQLERRMRDLCKEQQFLVQDRLLKLKEEFQRREDAAAFESFAVEHAGVLSTAAEILAGVVESIKAFGIEIEHSYEHLEAYLSNDVAKEVDNELLSVHKDRLEQFRQLYSTLGDLQFKKNRHLEEVAKKISDYVVCQESAMDTFNPKAKIYSQARKNWETVHKEVQQQLDALNRQCEAEITAFKRTEQALITAGVDFVHPVEEVAKRNQVREQKLLEYRELMNTEIQRQTLYQKEKAKNIGDGKKISHTTVSNGLDTQMNDSKKVRESNASPKADSNTRASSASSRRLPFLFSTKSKPSKTGADCEAYELGPSSRSEKLSFTNGGVTQCMTSGESFMRPKSLHATEEMEMCSVSIVNPKK